MDNIKVWEGKCSFFPIFGQRSMFFFIIIVIILLLQVSKTMSLTVVKKSTCKTCVLVSYNTLHTTHSVLGIEKQAKFDKNISLQENCKHYSTSKHIKTCLLLLQLFDQYLKEIFQISINQLIKNNRKQFFVQFSYLGCILQWSI